MRYTIPTIKTVFASQVKHSSSFNALHVHRERDDPPADRHRPPADRTTRRQKVVYLQDFLGHATPPAPPIPRLRPSPTTTRATGPPMPVNPADPTSPGAGTTGRPPPAIAGPAAEPAHRGVLAASAAAGNGVYLGRTAEGWAFAPPQHSVLVLGPPRSGKTSSILVPNVLAATGPVVATSTKPDVLEATLDARRRLGRCQVFDPTGRVRIPPGATPVRWSPLQGSLRWEGALAAAHLLTEIGTSHAANASGPVHDDHWHERARALLAPLLHAAALDGAPLSRVLTWVDRRETLPALQILAGLPAGGAELAEGSLQSVADTDPRELSGIWSTAAGALAGYRTEAALAVVERPDFDADRFVESADTVYLCATGHRQALAAPLIVGFLADVRAAAFDRAAGAPSAATAEPMRPPVLFALDEVANIAPIPDLPALVSEGGGQGVTTLACLQDLSQARHRWGGRADGFFSVFGTAIVLPGIGDVTTLEALSRLAGDEEVATRSVTTGRVPTGRPWSDLVTGGRWQRSVTDTTTPRPRLPLATIARGRPGEALAFDARNQPGWITLTPAHRSEPWRTLASMGRDRTAERGRTR